MSEQIEAGDSAQHAPTGETWFLVGVNQDENLVCAAGWPPTTAALSDMTLVRKGDGLTEYEEAYRNRAFGSGWDAVRRSTRQSPTAVETFAARTAEAEHEGVPA